MTFDEVLTQVLELFQRQGRVSYGALKRRYDLDNAYLEEALPNYGKVRGSVRKLTICWLRYMDGLRKDLIQRI
jgi:hypothetical protein